MKPILLAVALLAGCDVTPWAARNMIDRDLQAIRRAGYNVRVVEGHGGAEDLDRQAKELRRDPDETLLLISEGAMSVDPAEALRDKIDRDGLGNVWRRWVAPQLERGDLPRASRGLVRGFIILVERAVGHRLTPPLASFDVPIVVSVLRTARWGVPVSLGVLLVGVLLLVRRR